MVLRLLGTAVTDANGLAVLPDGYTGTGAGEVDIIAQTTIDESTVVSNTDTVLDCAKYDKGLSGEGNHNDIWTTNSTTSLITVTRTSEYTEFKETNVGNNFTNATDGLSESCIVEFDYYQFGGQTNTFMQLTDSGRNPITTGGINLSMFNGSLETWYHFKITIQNRQAIILNETTNTSITKNLSNAPSKFQWWSSGDVTGLRFKEFKIYPI